MSLSEPVELVRRLGAASQIGAIVMAEQAVDATAPIIRRPDDRAIALDILLRDLARLRVQPALDASSGRSRATSTCCTGTWRVRPPEMCRPLAAMAGAALVLAAPAVALDRQKAPVTAGPDAVPVRRGRVSSACPGSGSCIRVSGRVIAGMDLRAGPDGAAAAPVSPATSRSTTAPTPTSARCGPTCGSATAGAEGGATGSATAPAARCARRGRRGRVPGACRP